MRSFTSFLCTGGLILSSAGLATAGPYRLPWPPALKMELTQDCNDSAYADHVGSGKNAWDFANGSHFPVSAARDGIVTHVKMSSNSGCDTAACVDFANYVVVDHGDGTASVYLHLEGASLAEDVRCGEQVHQGQRLAAAGSTGWSTGPHLHFQVDVVHPNDTNLCECGDKGLECEPDQAAWSSFWSSPKYPSLPVAFDEWPASECGDRRVALPFSQNVDQPKLVTIDGLAEPGVSPGPAKPEQRPLVMLGIGGRRRVISGKSRPPLAETPRPSREAPSRAPAPR